MLFKIVQRSRKSGDQTKHFHRPCSSYCSSTELFKAWATSQPPALVLRRRVVEWRAEAPREAHAAAAA